MTVTNAKAQSYMTNNIFVRHARGLAFLRECLQLELRKDVTI